MDATTWLMPILVGCLNLVLWWWFHTHVRCVRCAAWIGRDFAYCSVCGHRQFSHVLRHWIDVDGKLISQGEDGEEVTRLLHECVQPPVVGRVTYEGQKGEEE